MKQAAKTNSRASVASYAVCLTALASILMISSLLASPAPGDAAPAPPSAVSTKGTAAKLAISPKSYEGLSAHQTTGWGVYDTKACPAGIRIQAQTGTVLVATPPDWTVYLFRKGQKKAAKLSYAMFRTKNRFSLKLSDIREKPRTIKVAGNRAISYTFEVNKRLDETTMYRSRQAQPIVLRKEVVFASETNFIPKQAKEIWRSYFESPVVEEIPLQTILYMMNGEKRVPMETITFKRETMTAADFRVPPGLSYTAQFVEMIYGKEMEGAADLLLEP
jgi:hypothetical protein